MNAAQAVVRIERSIPASPHQVYRAWLDPATVAKWLTPGGIEVSQVEVDERVGGTYSVWQTNAGADVGGFECELLELVPDKKIVFRWGFVGPERRGGPAFDSLLTIMLQDAPQGGTVLTLIHERLGLLAASMPSVAENVRRGWELALNNLGAAVVV